ncbi:hypothetical protein CWI42_081120 [Ordospora colligata]|uniref:Uncharacterized protein n=1 Tax=Ordospora colligata OC4 TaxID=1354746 RepID=A0A0B2UE72_9MICR|nr:uncharacterized protein M896_081120 [Ordospora colligata OC4]KHN69376.1 hypothetical protein M896_081120 [Ordospora colligata OC4]TBU14890.1 hypothetical protein CWI41_081110 [Ordospora colligata]TBU15021.1 hypothetical protein CWI40_081130 [Ordospora colligata]TBU18275.1 hypothetical protein CWI42_081120 [Ordospora colligata]
MIRLEKQPVYGKIYQIRYSNRAALDMFRDTVVIQTYGKKLDGSIICTNETDLLQILKGLMYEKRDILLLSPSTLAITNDVYKMFRRLNSVGISLFMLTLQEKPVWYADLVASI